MPADDRRATPGKGQFGRALLRFSLRIVGVLALAALLIFFGQTIDGWLRWVCFGAAALLILGLGLFGNALEGEVVRRQGPLPLPVRKRDQGAAD